MKLVATNKRWWFWENKNLETKHRNDEARHILLQKCGGLPKVICAVAETSNMVRDIKLQDNLVSKLEATRSLEDVLSWLLSYFQSCQDSLKPCIFYLSIFPVNHTIRRRRLIRRWIAEGYFRDNKESTAEENGERSFSNLVDLSMIQKPRTSVDDTRMPLCQVNGFLREYIVSRLMEENLVFELEGHCRKNIQRTGRHLAIDNSWDRDRNVFESIDLSLLRSLTVFGKWETFIISDRMRLLRVLDLEDVSSGVTNVPLLRGCREISHLPDSLGDLKQLQTLDIRETSVSKLPKSIIELEKLQYIRAGTNKHLQACEAAENPSAAEAAAQMGRPCATLGSKLTIHRRHGSHSGIKVPRGIGKLSSLHTLGVVNIHASDEDSILEELKNLTQLHKLGVSGINRKNSEKFFSDISRLVHLESLSLKMQANQDNEAAGLMADISSPLEKLRSLKLYGLVDRLPSWIMQMCLQLPRLEKVDLQMKTLPQQELDFILTLRYLRSLRLRLAEFQGGELRFGWSIAQRPGTWIIYFLEIACNSRLQAVKFGSRVDVVILKIRCCGVSSSLLFSGLQSLESLKEVWLSGSYDQTFNKHLEKELKENENKPILKLEEPSSSPDGC
uniref:NB-ARC domain-containing protein n=1 Tax=Setaria italica TaxID=4555 RepID=K3ZN91_SETIT